MDYNAFLDRIRSTECAPKKFFIVDAEMPLPVMFGLDGNCRPTMLVEDIGKTFSPNEIPSTAQILVRSYVKGEKACLSFTLVESTQRDVFNSLCYDLFASTAKESKAQALLSLLDRFAAWQCLLKGGRPGVLSVPEQQGLAAELKALMVFAERIGFYDAVVSWVGPFMNDQDFQFAESWAEIKSCKVSATSVSISSVEQLDTPVAGRLIVYRIDRAAENKPSAFSLRDVVNEARAMARSAAERSVLETKLALMKYDDAEPSYDHRRFLVHSRTSYFVTKDFPCVRRVALMPAVTTCEYSLSLPALESFKEEESYA